MSDIYTVFSQNLLPIFLVAGCGFALRHWFSIEKKSLSSAVMNVLSPALVFSSLVSSQIEPGELLEIGLFTIILIAVMGAAGLLLAPILRLNRRETAALLILVMFANCGNYGLTVVQLRFGEAGLSRAVVYYVSATILLFTIGIFIASSGNVGLRGTISRMARLPAVYAAILAIIVYYWNLTVPAPIMSAINIAASGAIPVMLLVLGMQLADFKGDFNLRLTVSAISMRLLIGPIAGVLVAALVGLQGLSRSTSIIQSAMPSAVFTIILATEFDLPAPAVTSIVVLGTLISPLTISMTITLLGL